MKPTRTIAFFTLLLLSSLITNGVSANPQNTTAPTLTMPVEYINYTITSINGTLWAKIDGNYPIQTNCAFNDGLPMVYPMPPGSTNIQVILNEKEIQWTNYTATNPEALHQTAIGNWWMIHSLLTDVSDKFTLKIHYEHPLQKTNDRYLFLYDLNIAPYLSEQNPNSTAYFTMNLKTNSTNLQVFTAKVDAPASQWISLNYNTTTKESTQIVTFAVNSEYSLLVAGELPGDIVVMFSDTDSVPELPVWALLILFFAVFVTAIAWSKRKLERLNFWR